MAPRHFRAHEMDGLRELRITLTMDPHRHCHFVLAFGLIAAGGLPSGSLDAAAPPWAGAYAVADGPVPPFEVASIFPNLGGIGHGLVGNSQRVTPQGTYPIPSAARFDANGNLLWSVSLDAGAGASDEELILEADDLEHVFAGYVGADGKARFGVFRGADRTRRFAFELAISTPPEQVSLSYLPGPVATVLQDRLSTLHLLALNGTGNRLFDAVYSSADFGAGGGIPGLPGGQSAGLERLPDLSGFTLTVAITRTVLVLPLIRSELTVILARLNNDGSVAWARKFTQAAAAGATVETSAEADGSILLRIREAGVDLITLEPVSRTHVLRITPDGNLAWARTLDQLQVTSVHFGAGGELWMSGNRTVSTTPPAGDFAIVRLDRQTGALLRQGTFDFGANDFGSLAGVGPQSLYVSVQSGDSLLDPAAAVSRVLSVDLNLGNPRVRRYTGPAALAPLVYNPISDSLLYSPFDPLSDSVRAIALNPDLSEAVACDLFLPDSGAPTTTGLSDAPLTLQWLPSTITVEEGDAVLVESDFRPDPLILDTQPVCGGVEVLPVTLGITRAATESRWFLSFLSQSGVNYTVEQAASPGAVFQPIGTVPGTGAQVEFPISEPPGGTGYYRVGAEAAE